MDFKEVRSNFGLAKKDIKVLEPYSFEEGYKGSILESDKVRPTVIEGADVLETLIPVSKFTGHRENPLSLLGKITGAKSDLLNAVLQELPVIASDSRLTDEDRANYLVSRLSSGTPAEDAIMAKYILDDLEALGLKSRDAKSAADSVNSTGINFDGSDVPETNETK